MIRTKHLLTSALALGFSAGLASGQNILVDFQNVVADPAGNWNIISSNSASNAGLDDTDGNASGISLSLNGWTSSNQANAFQGRLEAPGWATAAQDELNDRFFTGANSTASVMLSGLDSNLTYSIELVSSSTSVTGQGNLNRAGDPPGYLRITDPKGVVPAYNGLDSTLLTGNDPARPDDAAWSTAYYGNDFPDADVSEYSVEGWIVWNEVMPDAGNSITIHFTTLGGDSRASINAMQITVIPEPRAYAALFGLLALGVAFRMRRRV
ncbi:MAG: hypothetical protein JJU00_08000 [Opitutales bacterium]|nr:hypothetical protein [Opitutales bacterium]